MKVYDPSALGLIISKTVGEEARLRCPFHNDAKPSATFNMKTGLFHCFGCGFSANAFQLRGLLGGSITKVDVSALDFEAETREWRHLLHSELAIDNPYLLSRKVNNEQVERFGIMQTDDGVLIPAFDKRGNVVGIQMRRYDNSPRYVWYGDRTPVWPLSSLKKTNNILVEGVFGVLRLDRLGIEGALSTLGASAIPPAAKILEGHMVTLLFDADTAGYSGAYAFMKLHSSSYAIVPGAEADELTPKTLKEVLERPRTREIVKFATENKLLPLLNLIKLKEKKRYSKRYIKRKV